MPAFNGEPYIGAAIRSVLAQSYARWELLILDDGSTDRTAEIAEAFERSDPRIRLFRNPKNLGAAQTRNRGFALAQGEWIALLDCDDIWHTGKLEKQLALAYATIATSVGYIIVSFYKVLLLVLGKDVRWFAISNTIDYAVAAIVFLGLYKWRGGPRLHISPAKGRALLRQSGSFILCGLMVSVYNCTDRFMLKHLLDEASVGYYATATSLATVWTFVLSAIIDSITPGIMQAHRTDRAQFVRHNRQLYALVFYLSVAVSTAITLLARPAVSLLYGEAYLPAVRPMQVITWYTAFSYLGVARGAWVVCEGKQKYLTPLYIGSALVNVALNFLLIPCWGATGAAVASLLTQISTTFVFSLLLRPLRPNGLLMCQAVLLRDVFPKRKKTDNSQRKAC